MPDQSITTGMKLVRKNCEAAFIGYLVGHMVALHRSNWPSLRKTWPTRATTIQEAAAGLARHYGPSLGAQPRYCVPGSHG
jgi:hypothetical protein